MPTQDILTQTLSLLRFKASVFFHSSYCGAWTLDTSGTGKSTFHVVSDGNCWLHMPELDNPISLGKGDLVIFPKDASHVICDQKILPSNIIEQSDKDPGAIPTALICGYFEFDCQKNPIINALPDWILVRSNKPGVDSWLGKIIDMMRYETDLDSLGTDAVIDKLSEILFIYVVRHYIQTEQPSTGILATLSEPKLNQALQAFHSSPEKPWTVVQLAKEANMSRSAFSSEFSEILGESPMQYVAEWRMQLAYTELLESTRSILDISESVGYSSESAFRKSFKNIMGFTPGSVRRQNNG